MRFIHLFFTGLLSVFIFTACQKEVSSDGAAGAAPEVSVETCPSLAGEIAHLDAGGDSMRTKNLLTYFTADQIADLRANTCLTKDIIVPAESGDEVNDRASGLKNRYWTPGQEVRVRFLNGSAALQNKVFSYAKEWENYADIHFVKVTAGASEIRIMFEDKDGHWSYIGTENLSIEACEKTMNLALADNTPSTEIRRVVLHEFGHVLGMRHEHQQPLASIAWNTTAVYAYYAQQDWTKQDVDDQVLDKNSAESSQYTAFDAQSIMEYAVSAALTNNGSSIPWNTQLSATDKSFITLMYASQRIKIRHAATGYAASITFLLDGIYHTVKSGETLQVPVYSSGNQLSIRESSGSWDSGYTPAYGKNYKIVRVGTGNDLTLVAE